MSSNVYSVGLRNVGSYQVSGAPFVSGGVSSAVTNGSRVAFPYVTSCHNGNVGGATGEPYLT